MGGTMSEGLNAPTVQIGSRDVSMAQAEATVQRQGNWFFWIAGLSLVNWAAGFMGASVAMIMGLGVTQLATGIAQGARQSGGLLSAVLTFLSLFLTALLAGAFIFLGVQARKIRPWAFVVGMALYALDALIFVLVGDWIAVAFHVFVLVMLGVGLNAARATRAARTASSYVMGSLGRISAAPAGPTPTDAP